MNEIQTISLIDEKDEKQNNLESLNIYRKYVDLLYYSYLILEKFPKCEKVALAADIKNVLFKGLTCTIDAHKEFNKTKRLVYLNKLDVNMKTLKVLIRISYKRKYISPKNYGAWSKKTGDVSNLMGGWIKSCLKP
jgi:hypothetical protein